MTEQPCRHHHQNTRANSNNDDNCKRPLKTVFATSIGVILLSMLIYLVVLNHYHGLITQLKSNNDLIKQPDDSVLAKNVVNIAPKQSKLTTQRRNFIDIIGTQANIHQFNRHMLLPLIKSIVTMDYFRYVKVNINRPCQLWCNADKCNLRDCKVKTLSNPQDCPLSTYDNSDANSPNQDDKTLMEKSKELATVNTELTSDQLDLLIKLFECNDNDDHDLQYVDLLKNPERFTGYSGESAHRIWRAIYQENCFLRRHSRPPFGDDLCYEERIFYEAISGLHSSISIHLCAEYPSNAVFGTFEPNLVEFKRRFDKHPEYLDNLYKLFQLELKALVNSKNFLLRKVKWPDSSTKNAIEDLLHVVDKFQIPSSFDMSLKPSHISHELASHFRNITTTIIDCVACDKCKLWGKVQLRGLGTAFKVLSVTDMEKLYLNHQEIASLINAIARLSHSIRQLEEFKHLVLNASDNNKNSNQNINLFK